MDLARPGGFQILPPIVKNLLIINIIVYFATYVFAKIGWLDLHEYLALYHWKSPLFKPWQFFTHIFMHANLGHLFFNMFALWMFGNVIENYFGSKRFLWFYIICGLGAAACHLMVFNYENKEAIDYVSNLSANELQQFNNYLLQNSATTALYVPMVGASGAIMGLLFAFGYLYPNLNIYVYLLFPLKAKYLVIIYAAIELFAGLKGNPADNVAHFAHLGGMLFAYLLMKIWKIPYNGGMFRRNF